jgi:hypothetical protein
VKSLLPLKRNIAAYCYKCRVGDNSRAENNVPKVLEIGVDVRHGRVGDDNNEAYEREDSDDTDFDSFDSIGTAAGF